tara:strand:- start:4211 stop:4588 length:378 start_codon:yes stop_codon:yes gene_type:complete
MKTGIELIAEEREEQIVKHGWDLKNDQDYGREELIKAALFCIDQTRFEWPYYWTEEFRQKILSKTRIDQLKVAGALIAAEIDRLSSYQMTVETTPNTICVCGNDHPLVAEFGKCGKCTEQTVDLP